MKYQILRLLLSTVGRLSEGIRLGWRTGFDSGVMLEYVYENRPRGTTPLGVLIDRQFLKDKVWDGVRSRRGFLVNQLKEAIGRYPGQPAVFDLAAGVGSYLFLMPPGIARITAGDYEMEAVEAGRRKVREGGRSDIHFERNNAFDLGEFAAKEADILVSSGFFDILTKDEQIKLVLKNGSAITRSGARWVFTIQEHHPDLRLLKESLIDLDKKPWDLVPRPAEQLVEWATPHGWKLEKLERNAYFAVGTPGPLVTTITLDNTPLSLEASTTHVCLVLHGLGGGTYEMEPLARYLHSRGLSVRTINYPGHDKPTPRMPSSTWQQWYAHAEETYRELSSRYEQVSVLGFSTGCPLGLHLAACHPVARLVLLSPYMAVRFEWYYLLPPEAYLFSIGRFVEDVPRRSLPVRDRRMREAAEQAAYFRTFNLPSVRSAIQLIDLVKTELGSIRVPALIIQSPKDSVVAPSGADLIYRGLASPDKRLHWLKESDHIITLDLERDEVFEQAGTFLQTTQD